MSLGWNAALNDLILLLAGLYPDRDRARFAVREAGLDPDKIEFTGPPPTFWMRIVEEANKRDQISALLRVAQGEFPNMDFGELEEQLERASQSRKVTRPPRGSSGWFGRWALRVGCLGLILLLALGGYILFAEKIRQELFSRPPPHPDSNKPDSAKSPNDQTNEPKHPDAAVAEWALARKASHVVIVSFGEQKAITPPDPLPKAGSYNVVELTWA
jgi:hypothetical protein